MSIALTVKHLLACGASHEAVVRAVEEIEASKRTHERDRKREYRSRLSGDKGTSPPLSPPMINNSTPSIPTPDLAKDKSVKSLPAEPLFEDFWGVYPRKVGKGAARKAFRHACTRASAAEIIAGAKRYAASKPDPEYTKHPSTWLNADCWLDESNVVSFRASTGPQRTYAEIKADRERNTP